MRERLLICDDERTFGRYVRSVAEGLGQDVVVTTNGSDFIEAYGKFNPTTVLIDMIMPGMDGNEIILWLAEHRSSARLVVITGYTPDYAENARVLAEFKGLGRVTALRKPVEVEELRSVLKH